RASTATGNNYFKVAGILMLIGSLIPLGGYIAYIAGLVVLLLAFYTLKQHDEAGVQYTRSSRATQYSWVTVRPPPIGHGIR
ncbi:MAG: hypothetical protein ACO2O2_07570, partial [Acidilobaceae archaeon]